MSENKFTFKKNGWLACSGQEKEEISEYSRRYMGFLDEGRTERECHDWVIQEAKKQGFINYEELTSWTPGQKIYMSTYEKAVILAVLGKKGPEKGLRMIASHTDSPRLDIKPSPLREEKEFALMETHYYGGVKKYQWLSQPLALHGIIIKKDGSKVQVNIGHKADDPVFIIPDILPHLAKKVQYSKTVPEAFPGEKLDLFVGSQPVDSKDEKELVKTHILNLLHETLGIEEADFVSAELEVVPANSARFVGFDRSMIGAYGQDDRVCSFAGWEALQLVQAPEETCVVVWADKEEIGSTSNTGMKAAFIDHFASFLLSICGKDTPYNLYKLWSKSSVLSADVNAGVSPLWREIHEETNACHLGHGVTLTKYTGSGGKGGCNDANAEFLAKLRNIFDENNVCWQVGALGKVDEGGGGTVAFTLAERGAQVVDLGTPVLGMHSLFELTSSFDVFHTYKACCSFFK